MLRFDPYLQPMLDDTPLSIPQLQFVCKKIVGRDIIISQTQKIVISRCGNRKKYYLYEKCRYLLKSVKESTTAVQTIAFSKQVRKFIRLHRCAEMGDDILTSYFDVVKFSKPDLNAWPARLESTSIFSRAEVTAREAVLDHSPNPL